MMFDLNRIKNSISTVVGTVDGINDTIVGSPYFNKLESAKPNTIYIATSPLVDSISLSGTGDNTRINALKHELRFTLLYTITRGGDSRKAEQLADDLLTSILAAIQSDYRLGGSVELAYPENIEADNFGKGKTARIITLKVIVHT